jgi:hypothetical protein
LGDFHRLGDPFETVNEQHCICGLGRCRRTAYPHGDADIGRGKGWRVVDAVTCHQHHAIGSLGDNDTNLLAWQKFGLNVIKVKLGSDGLDHGALVAELYANTTETGLAQSCVARPASWRSASARIR